MFRSGDQVVATRFYFGDDADSLFVQKDEDLTIIELSADGKFVRCMNEFLECGLIEVSYLRHKDSTKENTSARPPEVTPNLISGSSCFNDRPLPSAPPLIDMPTSQAPPLRKPDTRSGPSQSYGGGAISQQVSNASLQTTSVNNVTTPITSTGPKKLNNSFQISKHLSKIIPSLKSKKSDSDLFSKRWYVGTMSRPAAESLLGHSLIPEGTFLVRISDTTHGYVLTIKGTQNSYRHRKITRLDRGYQSFDNYHYETVTELVEGHCTEAGGNFLKIPYDKQKSFNPSMNQFDNVSISLNQFSTDTIVQNENWFIRCDQVKKLGMIGHGYFGKVWRCKLGNSEKEFALKTLNSEIADPSEFQKEAETMKNLRHPYLVKLYGICKDPEMFLLLEYYRNGSVNTYLKKHSMNSFVKFRIVKNVANGMKYLADMNYVHRDLAARNVLLADDLSPRIGDFGLARITKEDVYLQTTNPRKPWRWTAPENLVDSTHWSSKSDVWSFGVFCWELYSNCNCTPYNDIHNADLLEYLNAGNQLTRPDEMQVETYDIIRKCFRLNPILRPTFKELEEFLDQCTVSNQSNTGLMRSKSIRNSIRISLGLSKK